MSFLIEILLFDFTNPSISPRLFNHSLSILSTTSQFTSPKMRQAQKWLLRLCHHVESKRDFSKKSLSQFKVKMSLKFIMNISEHTSIFMVYNCSKPCQYTPIWPNRYSQKTKIFHFDIEILSIKISTNFSFLWEIKVIFSKFDKNIFTKIFEFSYRNSFIWFHKPFHFSETI